MFKIKLGDFLIVNGVGDVTLNPRIANVIRAKHLPIKTQYHLAKIGKRLEQEIRQCQETRFALIQELGAPVMTVIDGKETPTERWQVTPEHVGEFGRRMAELLDVDVEIDLKALTVADLGERIEGTTPDDLVACLAFVLEERPSAAQDLKTPP